MDVLFIVATKLSNLYKLYLYCDKNIISGNYNEYLKLDKFLRLIDKYILYFKKTVTKC